MAAAAMEDFTVSEDVAAIREAIQAEVAALAKELQDKCGLSKDEATDTAKKGLLEGIFVTPNGNISAKSGSTVEDVTQQHRKKIPHFLMITAATEPEGSHRRKNELVQRRCEAENLMKSYELDIDTYMEYKEVNSYAKMIQEVKSYVKDRTNVSQLPFIVFWGHGSEAGELKFLERPWKLCIDALVEIKDCFKQNKVRYMPKWQLRVVFSQCFAHLIDNADLPGKIQERGIEYVYVTSSGNRESHSNRKITTHHISSLQKMAHARDVHLDHPKLDASMLVVQEAAAELVELPVFQGCRRKDIVKWLSTEREDWKQLSQPQREELEKRQTACKKKMARYLQLSYGESGSTAQPFAVFDQFLVSLFEVDRMQIESHADADYIAAMIGEFLAGPADDVIMPVVLIRGKGRVDETNKLILECSGGDVEADKIFQQFRHSHADALRMVFCCYREDRASDVVWFSSTKQSITTVYNSKNVEMEQYCMAIIGNGPKNKNIHYRNLP